MIEELFGWLKTVACQPEGQNRSVCLVLKPASFWLCPKIVFPIAGALSALRERSARRVNPPRSLRRLSGWLGTLTGESSLARCIPIIAPLKCACVRSCERSVRRGVQLGATPNYRSLRQGCRIRHFRCSGCGRSGCYMQFAAPPAFRATLLKLNAREHFLLMTFSHVLTDGWSTRIVRRDIELLYGQFKLRRSLPPDLRRVSFPDFAYWQNQMGSSAYFHASVVFWRHALAAGIGGSGAETRQP